MSDCGTSVTLRIANLKPIPEGEFEVAMKDPPEPPVAYHIVCSTTTVPNTYVPYAEKCRTGKSTIVPPMWMSTVELILEEDHRIVFDFYGDDQPASQRL